MWIRFVKLEDCKLQRQSLVYRASITSGAQSIIHHFLFLTYVVKYTVDLVWRHWRLPILRPLDYVGQVPAFPW